MKLILENPCRGTCGGLWVLWQMNFAVQRCVVPPVCSVACSISDQDIGYICGCVFMMLSNGLFTHAHKCDCVAGYEEDSPLLNCLTSCGRPGSCTVVFAKVS